MIRLFLRITVLGAFLLAIGFVARAEPAIAQAPTTPVFLPQLYNGWLAPREPVQLSPTVGRSTGGNSYLDTPPNDGRVSELWISAGTYVEGLQVWYIRSDGTLSTPGPHGGWSGTLYRIVFAADEYMVALNGKGGLFMDSLSVVTNKRTLGPYGGSGGDTAFSINATTGYEIVGFFGRAGQLLDYTGALARPRTSIPLVPPTSTPRQIIKLTPTVGWAVGGYKYEDTVPDDGRVVELWVRAGTMVDSLQMWYLRADGTLYSPGKRGLSPGGDLHRLVFDADEYITELNGRGGEFMDALSVVTNKRTYGPWGGTGGSEFSIHTPLGYEICGFFGQYALGLDLTGALARQRR